ncbi:MAG: hypothetical protein HQK83_17225 [Fibrobacteria bacterium]|nr:hypothetical protein [Fibrobacteria bacterium]
MRIKPVMYYKNNTHRSFRDDESYSNDKNVYWQNEGFSFGSSTELNLSNHFNIEYGILLSHIDGDIFISHEFGWGARRTIFQAFGIRIDNLITIYNQKYQSELVREESEGEDSFYYKNDSRKYSGWITSLTINSLQEKIGLNYFFSVEGGFYKYFFSGNSYSGVTGGVYKNLSDKFRIIGDIKYCYYGRYEYQDPNQFTYMVTFDYHLGTLF